MNKTLLMMTLCMGLTACGSDSAGNGQGNRPGTDVVEVLYFHGNQRCPTCKAIEEQTKEVISAAFADETKDGTLVFKALDIDENEALADKYRVTWSSLILVDHDSGEEKVEDLTKFAFGNALKSPDTFRSTLAGKIKEMLN